MDTNILLAGVVRESERSEPAREFLESLGDREDVGVSEFVLVELYGLLRNPKVVHEPLNAGAAVEVCQRFRRHPRWRLVGFPADSAALHEELWRWAGTLTFPRRRLYDVRLGLSLLRHGVDEFATVNVKDFEGLGFRRVWNPLAS